MIIVGDVLNNEPLDATFNSLSIGVGSVDMRYVCTYIISRYFYLLLKSPHLHKIFSTSASVRVNDCGK